MDIKDLAGLSEPIKRLIEVVSDGVGSVFSGYFQRSNARAKAYEIRMISEAIGDASSKSPFPISYSDGKIEISNLTSPVLLSNAGNSLDERAFSRIEYQEERQQANIEAITAAAATHLKEHTTPLSPERPDEDWTARFFEYAKGINSEQMQELWGRLLAGEIVRPGNFSLRSLDAIRNLSKKDAEIFEKLGRAAFCVNNDIWFVPYVDKSFLKENFEIQAYDEIFLTDIGLVYPGQLILFSFTDGTNTQVLHTESHIIFAEKGENQGELQMPILKFTQIGNELLKLVGKEYQHDYYERIAKFYTIGGAVVKTGKIIERLSNGGIRFDEIEKFTNES